MTGTPRIYLDNNATTPLSERALEAMMPYLTTRFGNPSSGHADGRAARDAIERARGQVALLLDVSPARVIFTSCGTEANNQALHGALRAARRRGRHVITSPLEHPAVLAPLRRLRNLGEIELSMLPVTGEGNIDIEALDDLLREDTALVAVMAAHNELGICYPIPEIARRVHARGALLHSDAVQAAGKLEIRDGLGADTLTISAHKFHGPKGIGALFIRGGLNIAPMIEGGGQERGLRSGTENVAGIVGMGAAALEAMERVADRTPLRLTALREQLYNGLLGIYPSLRRNSQSDGSLPNTLHVSFPGVDASILLAELDRTGVSASAGSACHSAEGASGPSALRHAGLDGPALHGAVRFSLGRDATPEEINAVLVRMPLAIAAAREDR